MIVTRPAMSSGVSATASSMEAAMAGYSPPWIPAVMRKAGPDSVPVISVTGRRVRLSGTAVRRRRFPAFVCVM